MDGDGGLSGPSAAVRRRTVSAAGQCCGLRGSIDVNPSIELRVNQNEKVLACVPMNDDAHAILADMGDGEDLKGAKLMWQ